MGTRVVVDRERRRGQHQDARAVAAPVERAVDLAPYLRAAAALCTALAMVAVFLLGGLAVLVRDELAFGETALGAAASSFFAVSALGFVAGGRLSERLGAKPAMALAAVGSATALLGMALAQGWSQLVGALVVGGMANAVAHRPSACASPCASPCGARASRSASSRRPCRW